MWGSDTNTGIDAFGPVPAEVISGDGMHQGMVDGETLCTDRLTVGARGRTTTGQPALRSQGSAWRRSKGLRPRRRSSMRSICTLFRFRPPLPCPFAAVLLRSGSAWLLSWLLAPGWQMRKLRRDSDAAKTGALHWQQPCSVTRDPAPCRPPATHPTQIMLSDQRLPLVTVSIEQALAPPTSPLAMSAPSLVSCAKASLRLGCYQPLLAPTSPSAFSDSNLPS